jgi:hypothetical protein
VVVGAWVDRAPELIREHPAAFGPELTGQLPLAILLLSMLDQQLDQRFRKPDGPLASK